MSVHCVDATDQSITLSIDDLVDCQTVAREIAQHIETPMAIALIGTLGAGKTQWTRFFAMALGADESSISSPTFVLVHEYSSQPPIYHLDAYRIGDADELWELGIDEMLDQNAVTIIEWADLFPEILPKQLLTIHLDNGDTETARTIQITAKGTRATHLVSKLRHAWR